MVEAEASNNGVAVNSASRVGDDVVQARRFQEPGDATRELFEGFNDWSSSLKSYGLQAAYALIAANWAMHGVTDTILSNSWAKWSMVIAVGYIGIHLALAGWMTCLCRRRCTYADADKRRWRIEYNVYETQGSPWPYTQWIQWLGGSIRFLHVVGPLTSGALLIASMFV